MASVAVTQDCELDRARAGVLGVGHCCCAWNAPAVPACKVNLCGARVCCVARHPVRTAASLGQCQMQQGLVRGAKVHAVVEGAAVCMHPW